MFGVVIETLEVWVNGNSRRLRDVLRDGLGSERSRVNDANGSRR